jgi:hypothetical protein
LDDCDEADEERDRLSDLDLDLARARELRERLRLRDLLPPPGFLVLGTSQSAPMALKAL